MVCIISIIIIFLLPGCLESYLAQQRESENENDTSEHTKQLIL